MICGKEGGEGVTQEEGEGEGVTGVTLEEGEGVTLVVRVVRSFPHRSA